MAIETFDVEDTLDDGEVYGQFTNQEGITDLDSQVSGGLYLSKHCTVSTRFGYLVTTDNIGSIFSHQAEFLCDVGPTDYVFQHCGIYLGASAPTNSFDADNVATSLIDIYIRDPWTVSRLRVTRTNNVGAKEYWNFTTHAWQAATSYWSAYIDNNWYRFTFTRDATNTIVVIYDITGDTLIETITAINAETKAISNNAYFYFGATESESPTYSSIGQWDNAGVSEIIKTFEEVGSGSETLLADKVLLFMEIGGGVDKWVLPEVTFINFSDSGNGVENLLVDKVLLPFEDSGSGVDSWVANKLREFADSGIGVDVFLRDWTPIFTDSGSGIEAYYRVFHYPANLKRVIILIRDRK